MDNHQMSAEYAEALVQNLERTDDILNNGNCDSQTDCIENTGSEFGVDDNLVSTQRKPNSCAGYVISEQEKHTIRLILDQINALPEVEKFIIYMKLNDEISAVDDPLKQPLNPLGSRTEIHKTISWIKTHLEEDPDTSLPKQQVYDEYFMYCSRIEIKPLSQADFGKVMKQVYPKVRARRLGTRGNSRYCYSGLRNCVKLKTPTLPDLTDKSLSPEVPYKQTSLMAAAWLIVKRWSEQQLGAEFPSLQALAFFLVIHCSIGVGTEAAQQLTSATETQLKGEDVSAEKTGNRHREMQLQLQRKIQQKNEVNKERKRKNQSPKTMEGKSGAGKKLKGSNTLAASNETNVATTISPTQGKLVCDNSQEFNQAPSLPEFHNFQKPLSSEEPLKLSPSAKVAIPRLVAVRHGQEPSPTTVASSISLSSSRKCLGAKYKAIQPKPCDTATYNPQTADTRSQDRIKECDEFDSELPLSRERLNSISNVEKDAMDDYLGTNNSQHEEELSKYFSNNNLNETTDLDNTQKLSQLRQILQNGIVPDNKQTQDVPSKPTVKPEATAFKETSIKTLPDLITYNMPQGNNLPNINIVSSARRRVSFETPLQEDSIPPSPNTRRKNFSFTPISPGPQSPNGRQSKPSSTNASPFVSPRNTPVPRCKNNTHQNAGIMLSSVPPAVRKGGVSMKIKREPELTLEIPVETKEGFGVYTGKNYTAMSAPASPMLNGKSVLQKLLRSTSKVPYTPDYVNQQLMQHDSSELSQFFNSTDCLSETEPNYRSQSVPLHQMISSDKTGLLLTNEQLSQTINDFNDMDPIENETVRVNNLINTLDESCDTNVFNLLSSNNPNLIKYGLITNDNLDIPSAYPHYDNQIAEGVVPVSRTVLGRSQSIDVAAIGVVKCVPSRSVPSTPLPQQPPIQIHSGGEKVFSGQSSRSYPSTPLLNSETFNYNINRDCLLNGQPIKNDDGSFSTFINFGDLNGDNNIEGQLEQEKEFGIAVGLPDSDFAIDDAEILMNEQNFNNSLN